MVGYKYKTEQVVFYKVLSFADEPGFTVHAGTVVGNLDYNTYIIRTSKHMNEILVKEVEIDRCMEKIRGILNEIET